MNSIAGDKPSFLFLTTALHPSLFCFVYEVLFWFMIQLIVRLKQLLIVRQRTNQNRVIADIWYPLLNIKIYSLEGCNIHRRELEVNIFTRRVNKFDIQRKGITPSHLTGSRLRFCNLMFFYVTKTTKSRSKK